MPVTAIHWNYVLGYVTLDSLSSASPAFGSSTSRFVHIHIFLSFRPFRQKYKSGLAFWIGKHCGPVICSTPLDSHCLLCGGGGEIPVDIEHDRFARIVLSLPCNHGNNF
jgi:hypothetical protein